jgi:hypothetical protein
MDEKNNRKRGLHMPNLPSGWQKASEYLRTDAEMEVPGYDSLV